MTKRTIKLSEKLKATLEDNTQSGKKHKPENPLPPDATAHPSKKTKSQGSASHPDSGDSGSEDEQQPHAPRKHPRSQQDITIHNDESGEGEMGDPDEGSVDETPQDELGMSEYKQLLVITY
jgi:hypothetical protein